MIFVDTNYFLRFLLADNQKQFEKVKKLFSQAAGGRVKIFTSILVYFEIYWVLGSFYKQNKKDISKTLADLLGLEFIFLKDKEVLEEAIRVFAKSNLDLEDAYNLAFARRYKALDFATFDRKLAKHFS